VLALLLTLPGCANGEPSQPEAEQIVAEAASATAGVNTCKFDLDAAITVKMTGGTNPGDMETMANGSGAVDNAHREMKVSVSSTASVHGAGKLKIETQTYIVADWLYTKLILGGIGGGWFKTKLTDEIWEMQNQLGQQIELMETATEARLMGSEAVDGTDCYVVELAPGEEKLRDFLSRQMVPGTGIDWSEINLETLSEATSITLWIAKDTRLLMKSEIDMLVELAAEDIGVGEGDFEKLALDMNTKTKLYDYNEPVLIRLPEEALEAAEIPSR
jgi:hypothetical protein